ncbi:MAG: nucleotidyltransferase family protein [Candidatus Omnitrophota bacterium]
MIPEIEFIKAVVRKLVGVEEDNIETLLNSQSINWERFKEFINYHELTPFVYSLVKDFSSLLPLDLIEFLKNNHYCALVRCQGIRQEFLRILTAFEQAEVMLLPLKGAALLEDIYIRMPLRLMTDIDFLVKEGDVEKGASILYDAGYKKQLGGFTEEYWKQDQCHITFVFKKENKLCVTELHWGIDFKRKGRAILPEIWDRVREVNREGRAIKLLSPEDTLFSLALHARRFGKVLSLKNVYDAALLLNKYEKTFDWEYCLNVSKKYELCSALFFILYQVEFLSGLNFYQRLMKELNVSKYKKKLIQNFIEKYTFLPDAQTQRKKLYLKSHFLLYDTFKEPANYILNIPQEQFANYYGLNAYSRKANFFYKSRLFYMFFKVISSFTANVKAFKAKEKDLDNDLSFFETSGFSMWPFIKQGQKLIIKKILPESLKIGDIILYQEDNQKVCHRLVKKVNKAINSCFIFVEIILYQRLSLSLRKCF